MQIRTILFFALLATSTVSFAVEKNGFELADSLIPAEHILPGGPERDGIPAIDQPRFVAAGDARFLDENDRILGIDYKGGKRAYPVRILNWHEIVNDSIAGDAISITYCPLCGTGIAYSGNIAGTTHRFGVSGLLYNNDVLLYDRETGSLWSQILSQAISGKLKGSKLTSIPVLHTTWSDWRRQHPDTRVLSLQTGYNRDYSRSPYAGYEQSQAIYFPLTAQNRRYHPKERVLGIQLGNTFKAYPFAELAKVNGTTLTDEVAGKRLDIEFDAEKRSGSIRDASGKLLNAINSYWFAWYAFHPETKVFTAGDH